MNRDLMQVYLELVQHEVTRLLEATKVRSDGLDRLWPGQSVEAVAKIRAMLNGVLEASAEDDPTCGYRVKP